MSATNETFRTAQELVASVYENAYDLNHGLWVMHELKRRGYTEFGIKILRKEYCAELNSRLPLDDIAQ